MAQVVPVYSEIQALNTEVLTISFEYSRWASVWLEETNSPFPFLVDADRSAYKAYGLRSSALASWSPQNIWYYVRALLAGRETYGNRGDSHQLGGDFIVDRQRRVRLAHPSRDPTDRPAVEMLMATLRSLRG